MKKVGGPYCMLNFSTFSKIWQCDIFPKKIAILLKFTPPPPPFSLIKFTIVLGTKVIIMKTKLKS